MGSKYLNTFFDAKRPWSGYKDTVLDYYLDPYLEKVKIIGLPVCVVDMCAGRGEFKTGEPGSPLIIARRLDSIAKSGVEVRLRCYENHRPYFRHLQQVLKPFAFAETKHQDCFDDVDDIAQIASSHTTLLYIDPCNVSQLSMRKLGAIYDNVRQHRSVEVLLVFMATAFVRQAAWARKRLLQLEESGVLDDPLVAQSQDDDKAMWLDALYGVEADWYSQSQATEELLNHVAGGEYWKPLVEDSTLDWPERCFRLVDEYKDRMRDWFNVVESLPIYPEVSRIPKYWLLFASRYEPAFDIFNRAACKVTRDQRQAYRQPGTLFADTQRQPESAAPSLVDREVKQAAKQYAPCRWKELRWRTCGNRNVGQFTDSEVNQSIKRLLKSKWLRGSTGKKVEDDALISGTDLLESQTAH